MKFQKFLFHLTHLEIRRKIFFPHSNSIPFNITKNHDNFSINEFLNLSNIILKPYLNKKGFKGEKDKYLKTNERYHNRISITFSKCGKSICINCEIKKNTINYKEILEIDSFPTNFDFWKRISPDKNDNWWHIKNSKEENITILKEIIKLIEFEGLPFFTSNNKIIK